MKQPFQSTISELVLYFDTNDKKGLSSAGAHARLEKYGYNESPQEPAESWIFIFFRQFMNPLIYILLAAAALIYFISDDKIDAFIITGILLFNALLGTIQEYRVKKILSGLKQLAPEDCIVIRDGRKTLIEVRNVVPGDIIILQEGQRVPADARLIEAYNLKTDESMLTGESRSVLKSTEVIERDVLLPDRHTMVYKGTYVNAGFGSALVVGTGLHTELGAIQKLIQTMRADVPLVQEMNRLAWFILAMIFIFCGLLFVFGVLLGLPMQKLLAMLIALFICVIPEGLPVVLTVILFSGVYRMAQQKVLIKNLHAVEGLGHVQALVIDKTGTLTRNEMIVTHVFADNKIGTVSGKGYYSEGSLFFNKQKASVSEATNLFSMIEGLALLHSTTTITFISDQGTFKIKGDPTEAALLVFAKKMGMDPEVLNATYTKIYELSFDLQRRYHAAFFEHNGQGIMFMTSSPEFAAEYDIIPAAAKEALHDFLAQGLRVIAVSMKYFDSKNMDPSPGDASKRHRFESLATSGGLFLGFCGIDDSIRSEAVATIEKTRRAGLAVIMATGDHQRTALAIAKQVGIYNDGDEAIDGAELKKMSDGALQEAIKTTRVFSRVSPDQKLRIISALHAHTMMVAMTGDGINDAPSLVAADIGIGMGGIGTEVAQEASDIILLDDSVANILYAIEEGRHTLDTIRRVIIYFFSTNVAEVLVIFFTLLVALLYPSLHLSFPLTAAQILWLNIITDGFLDSALAFEKKERGLLFEQQWLGRQRLSLIDAGMIQRILFMAVPMALGSLCMFVLYSQYDVLRARTMTLVTLVMFQWLNAWNCRSDKKSIAQLGLFSNRWLVLASLLIIILQLCILYIAPLQRIFSTMSLNSYQLIFCFVISSSIIYLEEIRKWFVRRSEA